MPPATAHFRMRQSRRSCSVTRAALTVLCSIAAAAWPTAAHALPLIAGLNLISNARVNYVDSATGRAVQLTSDTVVTIVQPLEAVQLTRSQTLGAAPGGSVVLGHQLTNSGDIAGVFKLTATLLGGGSGAVAVTLVNDVNANGSADPGEPVLQNGALLPVAPAAAVNLLVVVAVPASAISGQSIAIRLTVSGQAPGAMASETDTINIIGPLIEVTQSASTTTPVPNGTFGYSLAAHNSGGVPANPVPIIINGQTAALFLLRDAVPANTTFASALSPLTGAVTLYHRSGDPPGSYLTVAPDTSRIDAVAWGLPTLPAGATLAGVLSVTVNGNAAGTLRTTAYADFTNQGAQAAASTPVTLSLPPLGPTVDFYAGDAYAVPTRQYAMAAPLYVQLNAAQCNTDPGAILTHSVTFSSATSGDSETLAATETAPNTGLFRVLPAVRTANAALHAVLSGDGILEVTENDRVTATLTGCGESAASVVLIDPLGVVFDSKTSAPIAGAAVTLIDVAGAGNGGHPGGPAAKFAADGVTPAASSVTTGSGGGYAFAFVAPSTYKLMVVPPNGLAFPSTLPLAALPAGRHASAESYGTSFAVSASGTPVSVDIPLDSGAAGGLFIQKTASKRIAAVGDFVDYSITINDGAGTALPALVIDDDLPTGFAYVVGSARLNGTPLSNPAGGAGPALVFGIGSVVPGTPALLTYRTRIGPAAAAGTGTNTAQGRSGPTRSNRASATVKIAGGALSDKAYLFGKVYADCSHDGVQDAGEPGIPGVRIYLDNGDYVVTDTQGKYSIYGLTARTYVAKLDSSSLPPGSTLRVLDNRNALDAGSQFVDLRNGELHKADFALRDCSPALAANLAARRRSQDPARAEFATLAASPIGLNAVTVADPRTQRASGIVGQRAVAAPGAPAPGTVGAESAATGAPAAISSMDAASSTVAPVGSALPSPTAADRGATPVSPSSVPAAATVPTSLAQLLPTLTPSSGFLDLADGAIVPGTQTRVRVKGAFGTQLLLAVNGKAVGTEYVGEKSGLESVGVTAWEYVGVDLVPGENPLELSVVDSFGNTRETRRIRVVAPGKLVEVAIGVPSELLAGGSDPIDVTLRLRDAHGVPVFARTELTLQSTLGEWLTPDLDPHEPGIQVFIEGGTGHFKLAPPADPGKGTLRVTSGAIRAEAEITFMPNLRPLLVAGMAEGIIGLRSLSANALVPTQNGDAFERQIQSAAHSFDAGNGTAAARASLFLKGKILGADLLTLAYDSDKPNDTPLLRDIQPDQFYPVYGDSSIKGYDAQSTGKLYARIDHGTSYGVYGDFSTQSDNPARVLTQYSRALNGAKTHFEDGRLTVDGFASDTSSTQVIDELPANGTSGPYQLSQLDPVLNSQRIDLITRDRNQPTLVLSDTPLTAFTDYAIDAFSGQVLLKAPVPSLDASLNPVYIRAVYEVNANGPKYWVGGVDLRERAASHVVLGGTFIRDSNPITRETLEGANFLWTPNRDTSLSGEAAQSQSDLVGTGGAHRLEFKHTGARVQARLYAVQSDATFNNPSSTYSAGAAEYGAKISAVFDAKNRLLIDALKTTTAGAGIRSPLSIPLAGVPESVAGGGSRQGESIALEHTLLGRLKLTSGLRHADSNGDANQTLAVGAVPNDYTSVRVRLDAPVPELPKAAVFAQYERAIDDGGAKDTTLGATYQLAPGTKFYATHQTSNSLSGDYALNPTTQNDTTVVGLDTTYMPDGKMFDEYRVGDGIDGRTARAAVGLRNVWSLAPGLGLSTSIQQVHPVSGVVTDRATALTAALEYTASADWKGSTRVEWSKSASAQTWLSSAGAAFKINPSLTALVRGVYDEQLGLGMGAASNALRQAQLGFAFRPVAGDVWNALAWVEHKRTDNGTLGPGLNIDESANIFSTHVNFQPSAAWVITGRYGIKRASDYASAIDSTYVAQIIGARSVWDLTARWDAGLQYFVEYGGNGLASHEQAVGGEIGYLIIKNFWLSVGYNFVGFKDVDLAGEEYTQRAFYLRMRFKFDENLFRPSHNAEALPANVPVMQ